MTKAKNKKAVPDICPEISNKISIRGALSVVEATRQNVLEAFFLPSNREKLPLVATESTSSSLAGFSSVKVSSKRHTWVSPSVASTLTKSPKVFNNRPVNKLVFPSIDLTPGAFGTTSSKKMSLVSAIVTLKPFVVPNEILDEISVTSSGTSSKIGQDEPLVVLPNVVSSGRFLPVLETKQSSPVGLPVLENWANQMETESSSSLWVASTLVSGATFKIKLAHIKTVFQSVHGFLGAKSVSKDNVKLFCMKFASQQSLKAVFLVELTSSVCLATLKIAKSLVVSESGSSPATVMLCDMLLGVSVADIKLALSVFGSVTCVILKPAGIWQYVVVYFEKLDSAVSALKHWSVLVDKDSVRILPLVNQNETILSCDKFKTKLVNLSPDCTTFEISDMISQIGICLVTFDSQGNWDSAVVKTSHLATDCKISPPPTPKVLKVFKSCFVGSALYIKTAASSGLFEFPSLVASLAASAADPAVSSRLDSLEKQISDLAALVKFIVEPVGSLVALVSRLLNDNAVKAVQVEKDIISMKSAANNFFNLMIGVSKDIACLRSEVDFSNMNYDGMLAVKPFFLSEDTIKRIIALWQMSGAETRSNIESTRLFLSKFIFDSRNLNGIIERICGLELFSPTFDSV
ncbi:hypothetical protein G9A89_014454 [Geosiphon pyriformis]|nr:hypothetical protein G9A89_014454 [Geosiphon pyriformis]